MKTMRYDVAMIHCHKKVHVMREPTNIPDTRNYRSGWSPMARVPRRVLLPPKSTEDSSMEHVTMDDGTKVLQSLLAC